MPTGPHRSTAVRARRALGRLLWFLLLFLAGPGCAHVPLQGHFDTHTSFQGRTDVAAEVTARVDGPIALQMPQAVDPGPVEAVTVRGGLAGPASPRVALIDLDGILVNQNRGGLTAPGENPVSAFREKLEAAAKDPLTRAVVLRVNSPGGSVTACDILADELRRFRATTSKPVIGCLMDLGTAGAYYVAAGSDRILAHPTTVTGGIGAWLNRYNLEDAMAQLNLRSDPIKSAPLVDMGSVTQPLPEDAERLLREITDGMAARFREHVARCRPAITPDDWNHLADGRVIASGQALTWHLVDEIGYIHEAIAEAERRAGITGAAVVLFQRKGTPTHSIYAITPNPAIPDPLIPFSYPGLDRSKLPTFLYLWAPDPTILPRGGP